MKEPKQKRKSKNQEYQETLLNLSAKLNELETQLKERDSTSDKTEVKKDGPEVGFQKFGQSTWKTWVSGADKGYHRSNYVDIRALMGQPHSR